MRFILGGKGQGKTKYARSLIGDNCTVLDLAKEGAYLDHANEYDILINIHEWVKSILKENKAPLEILNENLSSIKDKIIVGDEIGSGIVPIDPFERLWRDETGRVYQTIALNAHVVYRVFAGIPMIIKNEDRT